MGDNTNKGEHNVSNTTNKSWQKVGLEGAIIRLQAFEADQILRIIGITIGYQS
ncbi:MAG: hypothetical protein WCJ64_06340 [Rhodospirillaceae bacterium]